ncbi:MAG: restriction endonuclease subunit S, partial [Polyangiaceae bacterium]
VTTIGQVVNVRRGASPRPIQDPRWFAPRGPGWVRIADVSRSFRVLKSTEQYLSPEGVSKSVRLGPGDLVLSIAGTIGKPIILGIDACIHDGFVYFPELAGSSLLTEFLYYFFQHKQAALAGQGQPGTQKNVNTSIIASMVLGLPPRDEQRKIAAILSSVDDAIEATQAVIDQLGVVKKAMMAELLTRGLPGRHTRFKQTEIGEVPEEWGTASLGDLASVVTSGSRGWAQFYADQGALFLRITTLERSTTRLDLTDRQHVRLPPGSAEGTRTRVAGGDVLISITADLGIVGLVPIQGVGETYVNQHIALIRLDQRRADPSYMANVLVGNVGQSQIRRLNDAGAKAGLSLPSIRHLLVPLPPTDEQRSLAEPIDQAEGRLDAERASLVALRRVKAALMSVLLTGEVRVKPDEEAA